MVIFSSFHNESYLLPWWLEHHKDLFDHGVLFDYFSTDNSVEIIKKICPTWEVRPTKNKDWDFVANDQEFMDTEEEFRGYKIVLTTTEFLMGRIPLLSEKLTAHAIPIYRLVDNDPTNEPTHDKPLVMQKNFGFMDTSSKRRILHNYPNGKYGVGRHSTKLPTVESSMTLFKYVYSPYTEEFINRKLSMKKFINPDNVKRKWGLHHTWDRKRIDQEYKRILKEGKWT